MGYNRGAAREGVINRLELLETVASLPRRISTVKLNGVYMCEHKDRANKLERQLEKERIEHLQAIEQLQLTFAERELAESEKRLNDKKEKWYVVTAAMLPFALGSLGIIVAIVNYASKLS